MEHVPSSPTAATVEYDMPGHVDALAEVAAAHFEDLTRKL